MMAVFAPPARAAIAARMPAQASANHQHVVLQNLCHVCFPPAGRRRVRAVGGAHKRRAIWRRLIITHNLHR